VLDEFRNKPKTYCQSRCERTINSFLAKRKNTVQRNQKSLCQIPQHRNNTAARDSQMPLNVCNEFVSLGPMSGLFSQLFHNCIIELIFVVDYHGTRFISL